MSAHSENDKCIVLSEYEGDLDKDMLPPLRESIETVEKDFDWIVVQNGSVTLTQKGVQELESFIELTIPRLIQC